MKEIIIEEDLNERLDSYLAKELDISRSKIAKLIEEEKILVNNLKTVNKYKPRIEDKITINDKLDFTTVIEKENIPLDIVYEDEYFIIVNKESGMVTHPAPGNYSHTLVNAIMYHLNIDSTTNLRPGIVHRLDKDTSGLMLVAKTDKMLEVLSEMIKEKKVKRCYLALVEGLIGPESATIDAPIGRDKNNREKMTVTDINSKNAITHLKVIKRYKNNTLIECILDTGRTHQIRVHLSYINHPVVNDPIYNNKKATSFGQMLHSKMIEFVHPVTNKLIHFEVDPPKEFQDYLERIEKK